MKKIIPITLTLLFVCFASTSLADKGSDRSKKDGYSSKGARIERHLDTKGDRIEQRFDRKADHAAARGKYRQICPSRRPPGVNTTASRSTSCTPAVTTRTSPC